MSKGQKRPFSAGVLDMSGVWYTKAQTVIAMSST